MRPVLLLITLLLCGCGQLGPLYLPTSIDTTINETAPNSGDVDSDDISSNDAKESADDSAEADR